MCEGPTTGDYAKNVDDAHASQQISNMYSAAVRSLLALTLRTEMCPEVLASVMLATLLAWLCKVGFRFVGRAVTAAAKIMPRWWRRGCPRVRSEKPALKPRSEQAPKRERKRRKHQRVDEAPRFSNCRLMLVLVCALLALAMALKLESTGVKLSEMYSC